ncbi:Acyl-CoA synthetase [Pseudomonas syringae pv. actinidiae]|uniref:Acyl-CoA synthetase n=1 Tax=Pseudomonas syringae pv. actinidiae TaxID=103796 RepID=A0AAN4TLD1_PSESF|nr:Acyl-CoA synthetase [Pseudomonas syringae pv. actinidiae]
MVKIFRLNRGAHSTASLVSVKRLFSEAFKVSFATSTTCASINSRLLINGRRILQRYNRVSNSFFSPLSINPDPTSSLADLIR